MKYLPCNPPPHAFFFSGWAWCHMVCNNSGQFSSVHPAVLPPAYSVAGEEWQTAKVHVHEVTLRKHCSATAKPPLRHHHHSGHKSGQHRMSYYKEKLHPSQSLYNMQGKKISILPELVSAATAYVTTHGDANRIKSRLLIWSSGPLNIL